MLKWACNTIALESRMININEVNYPIQITNIAIKWDCLLILSYFLLEYPIPYLAFLQSQDTIFFKVVVNEGNWRSEVLLELVHIGHHVDWSWSWDPVRLEKGSMAETSGFPFQV